MNFVNSHESKLTCTLYISVGMAAKKKKQKKKSIKHKVLSVCEKLESLRRNNNTSNKKNTLDQRVSTQPGRIRLKTSEHEKTVSAPRVV